MRAIGCYIDGRFSVGRGDIIHDVNPANGRVIARVTSADAAQIELAIRSACAASTVWRQTPVDFRAGLLGAIADEIDANADTLAALETDDTGLLLNLTSQGHVPRAAHCFRYFSALAAEPDQAFPLDGAYLTWVRREPLGVVAVIAPWNAPLAVAAMNVAAALALGNCVILKPSERSPLSSDALAQIIDALEVPPGVFQVLQGGADVGRALAAADGIDGLCFVGGVDAGCEVMAAGARTLKRVTLELGGKSPTIVFGDCDVDAAVDGALLSAFGSNGEVCAAGSRVLVEQSLYAPFVDALASRASCIHVGDPRAASSEMGPLIDTAHLDRVEAMVTAAVAEGARMTNQGGRVPDSGGAYFGPVVLDRVTPTMRIAQQEVFGPVTAVMPFADEAEAVAIANGTRFGLHASIWSSDVARALRLAGQIEVGSVAINAGLIRDIRTPFGGRRLSGLGRTGGRWSLDAYSEPKAIALAIDPYPLPRLGRDSLADAERSL
ncbi:aldehyde dehydrogenase family protein [Sphingomonas sp. MMS24-J45]|uniref:aldehyde dehydrogenase family protein n=1 Tax=Sphingomonas sp. MMS24-J45 TaxID=3238806 RepID=UPI00384BB014